MINKRELENSFFNCFSKVNQFSDFEKGNQSKIVDVLISYFEYVSNFQEIDTVKDVKRAIDGSYELVLKGLSKDGTKSIQMQLNFYHKNNEDSVKVETYKGHVENGQNRWTMDKFTVYKNGIIGRLDSFDSERKKNIVSTIFKGDIVIPNKNNKKELYWLDGEDVSSIFSIGLVYHLKQTNNHSLEETLGLRL